MCGPAPTPPASKAAVPAAEVVALLVEHHRAFLRFVQRQVGSRELAEDILQTAFVRNLDKLDTIRDTAIGWFYAVLRNAIIDHRRRQTVTDKQRDRYVADVELSAALDDELRQVVCRCVTALAGTLKPAYADALQRIDVEGVPVKDYAQQVGISSSNAGVRVFRARAALRAQVARSCGTCADHGCLDCTCGTTG